MLLNCDCWRRLLRVPWTARRSNQSILKEISPRCSMEGKWCWSWNSNVFFTWWKELTHRKRPWCWERLKAGGEGDDRRWDGWMASPTQWTWVCANSRSWWWTGRLGVLLSMRSQRVGHDWATELNWWDWTELNESKNDSFFEHWVLSQLFHSPVSFSPRGSLVLLSFLPSGCCYLHIWVYYFSWQSWFQLFFILLAFHMMHSAYKSNKQSDNMQPWHSPVRIWNQSVVPCPVLTVASWPAYRFLRKQVRWPGIPISWRIFHSLLWSTSSKALV